MPLLLLLFAFTLHARPAVTWWVAPDLAKIRPLDPIPEPAPKTVYLYAARNEFEPFQIILRPEEKDISGADIAISDLRTAAGALISKDNVTVYVEQYVILNQPSSIDGGTGAWPDPLVPRTDRYAGERRRAFPLNLSRGRNQPLWIEVFVPENALPGKYTGTATLSSGGSVELIVPIHLSVWSFMLPSTSTLKSSFGFNGTTALKQHRGQYTSDADLFALTRLYAKAALLHRISTHGGSGVTPKYHVDGQRMTLDWGPYDSEVGPFLSGTVLGSGEPLHGARATTVELRTPASFDAPQQQSAYWSAWAKHFQEKGWDDRLFLYLWDEPRPADLPRVIDRGREALRAIPGLRNLLTASVTPQLRDVVNIWVPLVNCLEPKPGFDEYCNTATPLSAYAPELQDGKSLWFYQSCASHGCNSAGGPYFTGWPSYMIDAPGPANRVMQWIAWKYRISGELYYNMNETYAFGKDPWTNVRTSGGNGEGTLFYPGRPARIGGFTDIPIESIRLKLIREGMEDYEYLALIAKLAGAKIADDYANRIVAAPYQWDSNPETMLAVRREMGDTLDQLTRQRLAAGSEVH